MKHSILFDLPLHYDKGAVRESNGSFLCATTKQDGEAIAKAVNSYELLREWIMTVEPHRKHTAAEILKLTE